MKKRNPNENKYSRPAGRKSNNPPKFGKDVTNTINNVSSLASLTQKFTKKSYRPQNNASHYSEQSNQMGGKSSFLQSAINSISVTGGGGQPGRLASLVQRE